MSNPLDTRRGNFISRLLFGGRDSRISPVSGGDDVDLEGVGVDLVEPEEVEDIEPEEVEDIDPLRTKGYYDRGREEAVKSGVSNKVKMDSIKRVREVDAVARGIEDESQRAGFEFAMRAPRQRNMNNAIEARKAEREYANNAGIMKFLSDGSKKVEGTADELQFVPAIYSYLYGES